MQVYFNNLDPFALQLTSGFGIRWYGLAYLAGFLGGYLFVRWYSKKGLSPLSVGQASDFVTYLALGTMIGGRFGYCFFYKPELLISFTQLRLFGFNIPMWEALAVWEGGMASHGGILGLIVACLLFAKKSKVSSLHLMDLSVVMGAFAVGLGRVTNFINGELYGRACEGSCWWPVQFPKELHLWVGHWATRGEFVKPLEKLFSTVQVALETKPNLLAFAPRRSEWLSWINSRSEGSLAKVEFYTQQILLAVENHSQPVIVELAKVLTERHPSQLYQAVLEGFAISFFLFWLWRKPIKAGVIASLWGVLYSVMRIVGEFFRMPDPHLGFQWLGLTRGQWLSCIMLVSFLGFFIWCLRRSKGGLYGGWSKKLHQS